MKLFRALLAHCDQGTDRVIEDVRQRLPDKDIWVNLRGGLPLGNGSLSRQFRKHDTTGVSQRE